MSALEDAAHLALTDFFIKQNPVDIAIKRRSRTSDGAGGWMFGPETTLPAQTVRRVGINAQRAAVQRTNENGSMVFPSGIVIALPDADIKRFDRFSVGSRQFMVLWVESLPPWRKQAEVYEYAG